MKVINKEVDMYGLNDQQLFAINFNEKRQSIECDFDRLAEAIANKPTLTNQVDALRSKVNALAARIPQQVDNPETRKALGWVSDMKERMSALETAPKRRPIHAEFAVLAQHLHNLELCVILGAHPNTDQGRVSMWLDQLRAHALEQPVRSYPELKERQAELLKRIARCGRIYELPLSLRPRLSDVVNEPKDQKIKLLTSAGRQVGNA